MVRRWHDELRPSLRNTNLRLQDIDPSLLDDAGLRAHITELPDVLRANFELHFWLHGHDLTASTLNELPDVLLAAIRTATPAPVHTERRAG